MKTQLIYIMVLMFISTLSGSGQTINNPINRSTINWSDDMKITGDANGISMQYAQVTSKKKVYLTATTGKDILLSSVSINCSQIEFSGKNIDLNSVKIDCEEIIFDSATELLKISRTVKINAKKITFKSTGVSSVFKIQNSGFAELSIIGTLYKNNREITFPQVENFKVVFQEN